MAVRRAWSRSENSAAAFSSTAAQRPRMSGVGPPAVQLAHPRTLSASLPVREVTSPAARGHLLGLLPHNKREAGFSLTASHAATSGNLF